MSISIYRTSRYFELLEMPYIDLDISQLSSTQAPLLKGVEIGQKCYIFPFSGLR